MASNVWRHNAPTAPNLSVLDLGPMYATDRQTSDAYHCICTFDFLFLFFFNICELSFIIIIIIIIITLVRFENS